MAHHGSMGMSEELRKAMNLGPTGDHPQGRLTPEDEGGLRIAIGVKNGKVVVDFGTPTAWIGFDREQALALADSIRDKALSLTQGSDKA